jgi:hypothetical protein
MLTFFPILVESERLIPWHHTIKDAGRSWPVLDFYTTNYNIVVLLLIQYVITQRYNYSVRWESWNFYCFCFNYILQCL